MLFRSKFSFDSAVLLNCKYDYETTLKMKNDFVDTNFLILNRKLDQQNHLLFENDSRFVYETIPTVLPLTHSPRAAEEVIGWLEYKNTAPKTYTGSVGSIQNLP